MKKNSEILHTVEFYGGKLFIQKAKGILSGREKTLVVLQGYYLADGELTDRLSIKVFDASDADLDALETYVGSLGEGDHIGSICFAFTGGTIDLKVFEPKVKGLKAVR